LLVTLISVITKYGHVKRMEEDRLTKGALEMKIIVKDLWLNHERGRKFKLSSIWDQQVRNG
jgi:hypothetical protein